MSSERSDRKSCDMSNSLAGSRYRAVNNLPIGGSLYRVASVSPRTLGVANVNFRSPVVPPTQDNVIVHDHARPSVNSTRAPHRCQGCYYANNYNNFLQGSGATNVTNWLQGNPQRGLTNSTSVRFPPPARPAFPSTYPGNGNPNPLQEFNYIAHHQNLSSIRPMATPYHIYMPTGPAPTSNSIIIIPDDSPPRTTSAAHSSPLGSRLLVAGEGAGRDPSSKDKGKGKRIEEDGEHKCCYCSKLFDSGKALGGHMSAHEKKRKRELEEARRLTKYGGGTCSSRSFADRSDGRDELDAADNEDVESEINRRK